MIQVDAPRDVLRGGGGVKAWAASSRISSAAAEAGASLSLRISSASRSIT